MTHETDETYERTERAADMDDDDMSGIHGVISGHATPDEHRPPTARRVVVVAVGAVTAQGDGADELWAGVRSGRTAIGPVRGLPMDGYLTGIGGEVSESRRPAYDYLAAIGGTDREPALDFALAAAEEALAAAGPLDAVPADRWGVAYGTCNGGLRSAEKLLRRTRDGASGADDARHFLLVPPHAAAEALSSAFGFKGPALSVNTACASGAHALAHAVETIRAGRADAMLVGGSDAFTETAFAGFTSLESLSVRPAAPYSKDRDGLSLGEGSGMLVLVEESLARAAGAPILAEILGYGLSADGYHATAPHPEGEGAARAIRGALRTAGLAAEDVGYINGHGTGTPKNDSAESNAVRAALGEAAEKTTLSSTKSMIGHLLGAAGAVEAIVTVLALREQTAPPTANFTELDPKCGLDAVPVTGRPLAMDAALSNNFAFAGANACVAFARPGNPFDEPPAPLDEKVVVTGFGVISAAGSSAGELWETWTSGRALGAEEAGLRVARADFDPAGHITPRERRRMDRLGQLAVAATRSALAHAGLTPDERVGVVLGTGLGPMRSTEEFLLPVLDGDPSHASPAVFPNTVYNAAAGQVAMVVGTKGPTSTATAGHAAGASALTIAHDLLRRGHADAIVVPAAEDLSPGVLAAYRDLPLFSGRPGRAYTLAEGGIALVLERESTARARGARILAEFAGHATASDAVGVGRWDAHGAGVDRAMRGALRQSGVRAEELTGIWANAAGITVADAPEARATGRLAAEADCPVHTPKRTLGEPVGAGAQLSAVLALTGWGSGHPAGPVLINSSSLGGTHISVVLRPASPATEK
ncbi:beta-ketoacyl-[acyl-carrier-protein] synthase family protein [Streptomyces sp. DG2A-72]|uniref:beta-ketoacyl-[acyl-carrier-protein] synthase family protein n=1 Tax=Streptomyces sp. DG2A-72 TaxID=3051386 RepID=UPI00265C6C25|nr:beta-ketoacyl-[acyl-carrier-protein] synthase family protein [Streptomyces sp. DG2A-72]MDO0937276.1 beta-ketoacyl-[acyl-carrier-protein] synthase family protein [Streptomyces sp. DG2A-72]